MRALCEERLESLPLPSPFTLEAMRQVVSADRGKPLHMGPIPDKARAPGLFGASLALPDFDLVAYDPAASPLHRDAIVLHEFGHLLLDHEPRIELTIEIFAQFGGLVGPSAVTIMFGFGRGLYDDEQEQEAETFGNMILERVSEQSSTPEDTPISQLSDILRPPARSRGARPSRRLPTWPGLRKKSA